MTRARRARNRATLVGLASLAALAITCGPGHRATRPPRATGPVVSWSSPEPPYRLPATAGALWVDDRRAVIACDAGWFAEVDLATGAVTSRRTGGLPTAISVIAKLHDGRLIGLAGADDRLGIYAIAPDLAVSLVREDAGPGWSSPVIAVAADGRVALSGGGHTLDLYEADATTQVRTLSISPTPETWWSRLFFADGDHRLLAQGGGELVSFDLATGISTPFGYGTWLGASNGPFAIAQLADRLTLVDLANPDASTGLSEKLGAGSVITRDGTRTARIEDGFVLIQDTKTRAVIARFLLGEADGTGDSGVLAFTPSGERLVIAGGAVVRVVELAPGTITAAGDGPYRSPAFLAVTPDHVIAGSDRARRWPVGGGAPETIGPDEPEITDGAVSPSGALVVTARAMPPPPTGADSKELALTVWQNLAGEHEIASKVRKDSIASLAIADDGEVLVGGWRRAEDGSAARNVIDSGRTGSAWQRLVDVHYDSYVDLIDPVSKLAAVSRAGAVRLIQLPGMAALTTAAIPECAGAGNVHFDGARRLIATDNDVQLWIWDGSGRRGKRIAAAGFTDPVGEVVFVTGKTEVVFGLGHQVGLWDYTTDRVVGTEITGTIGRVAIDAAGTRVAIGQKNGRILIFAVDALRKGTPVTLLPGAPVKDCHDDPLASPVERPNR